MMQPTALRGYHRLGRSQLHQLGGCSPAGVRTYTLPSKPWAYWACYPDEIDAGIAAAEAAEDAAEGAWRRERQLFAG
jgi:hypothetical protein